MQLRKLALIAALAATGAFAACTLNPQPLPPEDSAFGGGSDSDASSKQDSGAFTADPTTADASPANPPPDGEGGTGSLDGGDGGSDAGDGGGDASDAADSG